MSATKPPSVLRSVPIRWTTDLAPEQVLEQLSQGVSVRTNGHALGAGPTVSIRGDRVRISWPSSYYYHRQCELKAEVVPTTEGSILQGHFRLPLWIRLCMLWAVGFLVAAGSIIFLAKLESKGMRAALIEAGGFALFAFLLMLKARELRRVALGQLRSIRLYVERSLGLSRTREAR